MLKPTCYVPLWTAALGLGAAEIALTGPFTSGSAPMGSSMRDGAG